MEKPKTDRPRLFVALSLPAPVVSQFQNLKNFMPGLNFPSNLHITLRFIGNKLELDSCAHCLMKVRHRAFELRLEGLDFFHEKILLARLERSESLMLLKSIIDARLKEIGIPADNKTYIPHITLCRFKRPLSRQEKERIRNLALCGAWQVDHFNLYRSLCESTGVIHILEKSYQLEVSPDQ